jgi:multicomponent K+:H+ antiporter subunit D
MPWVFGIILTAGLFGVIALARSGSLLFYRAEGVIERTGAAGRSAIGPNWGRLLPVVGLLLLCVTLVVWAGPLSDYTRAIAEQLLEPSIYIRAVLGDPGSA